MGLINKEAKNTTAVSIQMLVRTQIHTNRRKYEKIDNGIRNMVKNFHLIPPENYFKITRSVCYVAESLAV